MTTTGQAHAERRTAQAAAARKPVNKARALKRPGKGNRQAWKKDVGIGVSSDSRV